MKLRAFVREHEESIISGIGIYRPTAENYSRSIYALSQSERYGSSDSVNGDLQFLWK